MSQAFSVFGSLPEQHLFNWPPANVPDVIPPAAVPVSVMRPFNIPDDIYTAWLDPMVPLTLAILYAVTVKSLNVYNKSTGKKPWAISKTRPFAAFVVLHNIFLAVYSGWTFLGFLGAMKRSIANPAGPEGLAGTVDSFCRLHGSAGLGNSVYYNETTSSFQSASGPSVLDNGVPSSTVMGRLWTEGLAYYGWLFYLSKFYEVLDTFIILAKGKLSSTLQTYHHAGAMLCMWAGMRYMSAPIWMFVLYNSFIHSLMYFYYTVTAFSVKVPTAIKRSLTTMQITQFIVGVTSTTAHSFLSYTISVTLVRDGSAGVNVAAGSSDSGIPQAAANAINSLKQLVFGASAAPEAAVAPEATTAETQYITQPCIMTSGETLAIWINVLYLLPLTYLFVSFFIASYIKRSHAAGKVKSKSHAQNVINDNVALAEKASWDAAKGIEKEVYGGERMVNSNSDDASSGKETTPKKTNGKANGKARRKA